VWFGSPMGGAPKSDFTLHGNCCLRYFRRGSLVWGDEGIRGCPRFNGLTKGRVDDASVPPPSCPCGDPIGQQSHLLALAHPVCPAVPVEAQVSERPISVLAEEVTGRWTLRLHIPYVFVGCRTGVKILVDDDSPRCPTCREFYNWPVCMSFDTIQPNSHPTSVLISKMRFLRSQTTSGAGLKYFEWVFERKKKWKRKKNEVGILFENFQIYFKKLFIIRA
jgi:hypothetical protein